MARTVSITKESLLAAAFELTAREGKASLTARKLAVEAGCSTQPIFRVYKSMDELTEEVFAKAIDYFGKFCAEYQASSDVPFVNLGMAYISFAQQNKELFRMLFVSEERYGRSLYELLNGSNGFVKEQIIYAAKLGCKNPEDLFMKMWMFIHGSACMSLTDDYDLDVTATKTLLEETEKVFA